MAYDDPKLPGAVLRGEELFVGDDKEPYFRDPDYLVYLDVTDLKIYGGFEPVDITGHEGGFIQSVTWDESYGAKTPVDPDEPRKPTVVELPPRVYSLLGGILAVLAFIAALLLLRH